MQTIEKIHKYIEDTQPVSGADIAKHIGISRQAVNKHLKRLIQTGRIHKQGHTRGTLYFPALKRSKKRSLSKYKKIIRLAQTDEDSVFTEVATFLNLPKQVRPNSIEIIQYVFTEMLNNAIEHSQSDNCHLEVTIDNYLCQIKIRDFGIGLFYSIYKKFNLHDEHEAVGELIKGKTTTMAERHSGEGIFFTSKSTDYASFRSQKICLIFDNKRGDIFIKQEKRIKGTEVFLSISRNSKRNLSQIFDQFSPAEYDYRFEKTRVYVKLFQREFISRSEAKRLLSGLSKFKEIILDFKGVNMLGQGFADEIFRVFQKRHPLIKIYTENVSASIQPMIRHVVDNTN